MKVGNFIGSLSVCDICNRTRNKGNHESCSRIRKARFAAANTRGKKA